MDMYLHKQLLMAIVAMAAFVTTNGAALADETVQLALTPSSPALATCMPDAELDVTVKITTDRVGFDRFEIRARHLPPNRDFTVFLLEKAGAPFGAAEY